MEKSIEKIWNEAFINEKALIAPKINDLYNQKSKSLIHKIKRTYELDNKGLLPLAGIVTIGGILLSETVIGLYGTLLILSLYVFNRSLLKKFDTIDVKSDNLKYLKDYKNIMTSVTKATKKMFVLALPVAVFSIFILAYFTKEDSFLSKVLTNNMSFTSMVVVGVIISVALAVICFVAFSFSNKILYAPKLAKLNAIIEEMEALKENNEYL